MRCGLALWRADKCHVQEPVSNSLSVFRFLCVSHMHCSIVFHFIVLHHIVGASGVSVFVFASLDSLIWSWPYSHVASYFLNNIFLFDSIHFFFFRSICRRRRNGSATNAQPLLETSKTLTKLSDWQAKNNLNSFKMHQHEK